MPHVLRHRTHNRGLALMVSPEVGDAQATEFQAALGVKTHMYDDPFKLLLFGRDIRRMFTTYPARS